MPIRLDGANAGAARGRPLHARSRPGIPPGAICNAAEFRFRFSGRLINVLISTARSTISHVSSG